METPKLMEIMTNQKEPCHGHFPLRHTQLLRKWGILTQWMVLSKQKTPSHSYQSSVRHWASHSYNMVGVPPT